MPVQEEKADPIFLVSSPCSCSTMLCGMLAEHPNIFAAPGLNILIRPTVGDFLDHCLERPRIAHGLLRCIAHLYSGEQTFDSIEMARRWLIRRRSVPSEQVIKELCEKVAPARLVDRSLLYPKSMDLLHQIQRSFPDALFLHLTRHPFEQGMAVLQSIEGVMELWEDESVDSRAKGKILDPQYAWFETQASIMEFSDVLEPDRYIHVRAEDLVKFPQNALRRLCGWLGLPVSAEILQRMCSGKDWPFAGPGPYNASGGTDREPASSAQLAKGVTRSLDEALPWRSKVGLVEAVKILARHLGY
jgi:Sulfotransferase family